MGAVKREADSFLQKYEPLLELAKQELESKTEHKAMSEASYEFARTLLSDRNILVKIEPVNMEEGHTPDPLLYRWTVDTKDNVTLKKGEHQGTPGAKDWFTHNFLQGEDKSGFGLRVVTGQFLPTIKGDRKSVRGKGDLVIGKTAELMIAGSPYDHAYGLVELQTNEYPLKLGQNVLELTALFIISRFGQNVALLATDCNCKWELYFFFDARTIHRRAYKHGRKCWEDFKHLLDSIETRNIQEPPRKRGKQTLPSTAEVQESEQDLAGFEGDHEEDGKTKALERHAMLQNLANHLEGIYGERPSIPFWARAEATCPDYYL